MRKIRKNDQVVVLSGKDKGRRGTVLSVLDKNRVIVDGINQVKRHQKPNPSRGVTGGIVQIAKPMDVSKVALYNPVTGKGDRVGFRLLADGRKVRYFKSTNEVIDI